MEEFIYLNDSFDDTVNRLVNDDEFEGCGLNKENVSKTLISFQGDEIAASVFLKKYALRNNDNVILEFTLEEAKDRWAKAILEGDKKFNNSKDEKYFRELYDYFLPAGRQMFALGNEYVEKATLTNCYVTKIDDDSIEGIFDAAKKIARTYSYGGGTGLCIGELRPKDSKVSNTSKFSTGSVSFMKLYSLVTELIGQHGRRGALLMSIPVNHPDIEDFIEIKHNTKNVEGANISIKLTDEFMNAVLNDEDFNLEFITSHETIRKTVRAKELWFKIIQSARDSAEPGLLFWDKMVEMSPSDTYERLKVHTTNPCVTGDTNVYVADGRGNVPIKELAEKNEDVPVFCLDDNDKVAIRYMRNPRITGYNQPIYEVKLDDGNSFKVTANHKFKLRSGEYKRVDELKNGDSLKMITKFQNKVKNTYGNLSKENYYWISNGFRNVRGEHRYIAKELCGGLPKGYVVHHKDYNSLNNSPENLKVLSKNDHDKLHSVDMMGDNNPMRRAKIEWSKEDWEQYSKNMSEAVSGSRNGRFNGVTNEELKDHAIILTKKIGYRFSQKDWVEYARANSITKQFSKWRNDHLGGILGLAKWAALECGFENIDLDPRSNNLYKRLIEQGYNCIVKNNKIHVVKKCEICGNEFDTHHSHRETSMCSKECHSEYMRKRSSNSEAKDKATENMRKFYQNLKKDNAEKQVKAFIDLRFKLGREPLRKEWENFCKENNIAYRLSNPSYFKNYKDLKEAAYNYNHKVVSVEFFGYDNVYNGTVDEFHNFFVGGFENKTKTGKKKWYYFNNRNCGEQILSKGDACVLSSLILHTYVKNPFTDQAEFDFDLFGEMVKRGVRHLDNVVELNINKHPLEEQKEAATLGRRIGLGITGLADMLAALKIRYDSNEALEFVDSLMEFKMINEYNASIDLAKDRGSFILYDADKHFTRGFCANLPDEIIKRAKQYGLRNVAISTIAPNGSLSIVAQSSSGCEPIFALNYNRKVRLGKEDFKHFPIKHQGVTRFFNITGEENLPDYWITAHNINYINRIKMQATLQKYIDASISSTINLPKDVMTDCVGQIYMDAWLEGLKGLTVYREGSREGILTTGNENDSIEKSMDSIIYFVKAEKGDKFYITISYENRDVRKPYQVFVNNYKRNDTESFIKIGNSLVKMLLEKGVDSNRVQKYLDRSNNSLVKLTRFLSLSMKTDNLDSALGILNEHAFAGTLASNLHKILSKSVDAKSFCCPICKSTNIRMQESCVRCLDCNWEGCN